MLDGSCRRFGERLVVRAEIYTLSVFKGKWKRVMLYGYTRYYTTYSLQG